MQPDPAWRPAVSAMIAMSQGAQQILPRRGIVAFPLNMSRAKQTIRTLTLCTPAKIDAVRMETEDTKRVTRICLTAILPSGHTVCLIRRCTTADGSRIYPTGTIFRLRTTYRRSLRRKRIQAPFILFMTVLR